MEKPTLPKGTRDFGPAVMAKRQFIFKNIRKVFKKYGFLPLETPAMENLSTLTGKYGDEGDQLLFKILDSGQYLEKTREEILKSKRTLKIKDILFDVLYSISETVFNELDYDGIRDFFRIKDVYDANINRTLAGRLIYLDSYEKRITESFFLNNSVNISYELGSFYFNANLYPENFKKNFSFHFDQFRNTTLNEYLVPLLLKEFTSKEFTSQISEKGLRYDLTVPFARYVVMNRNEVVFPFKRYQIQPVWRGDRPQKGRYREFYQCDADVVGTDSLICEAEIILMIKEVFQGLGITDYTIKINHRGILSGIAEAVNAKENETALFVAIDKLDKIGEEKVKEELRPKGFSEESLTKLFTILNVKGSTNNKMSMLVNTFDTSEKGQKGLRDLQEVFNLLKSYGETDDHVEFDVSLARGLSYYTGCIFEVKINNVAIGSVSGGGRYDNLTQSFGDKEKLSGVGFSFGVDRIYDAMEEIEKRQKIELFSKESLMSSIVLVCHYNENCMNHGLSVLSKLRTANIASEIFPDKAKERRPLEKPMAYAQKKGIPFAIIVDEISIQEGTYLLREIKKEIKEIESRLHLNDIILTLKSFSHY